MMMMMDVRVLIVWMFIASLAMGLENGVGRKPPLGWNTWKTCGETRCRHDVCNEMEIKTIATAMEREGMVALGYEYVNLDDCWAGKRNESDGGTLTWDQDRFPSGIPALAQFLHERRMKLGLYASAGNQTCDSGGRPYAIPGSKDHYELDANTFASWGVDYVKLDWCGDIKTKVWEGKRAHVAFANAMNRTGRPMFLEVVAGYFFTGEHVRDIANSWRFCTDHHDAWTSTNEQMVCRLDQFSHEDLNGPGGWAYMDMLITGGEGCAPFGPDGHNAHCPGQTDDEYRTAFAVWSLTQSPLIVSSDVRNMTSVMRQTLLNEELVSLHQSTSTPPGERLAFWECAEILKCEIWGRRLPGSEDAWMVALVNRGHDTHKITVKWKTLGFDATDSASVFDVWNNSSVLHRNQTASFTATVPSHGTAVVRIVKAL